MIAIIDYGAGNLHSVKKAFNFLKKETIVATEPKDLKEINKIVLPGVGAFEAAINKLKENGFYEIIKNWLINNRPFLGICLGMQLLFEESMESKESKGFGIFKGKCLKFEKGKVPQIGWNEIEIKKNSPLLTGIKNKTYFYFLHSYFVEPIDSEIIVATTNYYKNYPSIIEKGNIIGVQFHPEKSGEMGLKLLRNWVEKC
ncbi:MAG: imidazole glycerol phosphate synthase subunit HisH [candidate division WOR-3 bacterium]